MAENAPVNQNIVKRGRCVVTSVMTELLGKVASGDMTVKEFLAVQDAAEKEVASDTRQYQYNWQGHTEDDTLYLMVDLTQGGQVLTKSKKSKVVTRSGIIPFKLDSEGNMVTADKWSGATHFFTLEVCQSVHDQGYPKK